MNDLKENEERFSRWRLILGKESESQFNKMGGGGLPAEYDIMDNALATIYGKNNDNYGSGRGAGNGMSNPQITRWLGDIRSLFDTDIVKIIQNDAINRKGMKELLFEPEILKDLEPDINLASTLLMLKEQIPKRSKESVRLFIQKIVEEINKLMENDLRRAVVSALNKRNHSPIPSASAMDYKMTISRNIKNYNKDLGVIIPEHFYFFDRANKSNSNTIIVDIDQSGSMGESVIYSSVMSCILASMNSIKTRIVAFDTEITDLTDKCSDPVDMLYGIQLGGGTDINKSIAYCQQFIESPSKTLFFLISDLDEYGNRSGMVRRLQNMKDDGVTVICLLAISDSGKPYYSEASANAISALGIPVFACNPQRLPELLSMALRKQDLNNFNLNNKV